MTITTHATATQAARAHLSHAVDAFRRANAEGRDGFGLAHWHVIQAATVLAVDEGATADVAELSDLRLAWAGGAR